LLKRTTLLASVFVISIFIGVLYVTIKPLSKQPYFGTLLKQEKEELRGEENKSAKQVRIGVSKDFWIHDSNAGRVHHHIDTLFSVLTAYNIGSRMHFVEQMIDVEGYLQGKTTEEKGVLMQQICHLKSPEANYRYFDNCFMAHTVFLSLFYFSGRTFSTQFDLKHPFMRGVVKECSFSFNDKPVFRAQKFKAHIQPQPLL